MTRKLSNDMTGFFRETNRMGVKNGGKRSFLTIGARIESASTDEERSERARKAAAASAQARKKGDRQRLPAVGPTLKASPVPTSRPQALILADQILNRLLGYARKGSRARKDFYRRDLNWIADVWMRVEAREHDPLRPTSY